MQISVKIGINKIEFWEEGTLIFMIGLIFMIFCKAKNKITVEVLRILSLEGTFIVNCKI